MSEKSSKVKLALVEKVAKSSGVSPDDVSAVLSSLGLDDVSERISDTFGDNFDSHKIGGVEISAQYDRMMVTR